jgi:hypothetical protein
MIFNIDGTLAEVSAPTAALPATTRRHCEPPDVIDRQVCADR